MHALKCWNFCDLETKLFLLCVDAPTSVGPLRASRIMVPVSIVGGTRSTFGTQSRGGWKSSPIYGFGSGTREGRDKVFISQEHAKLCVDKNASPGPAVYKHRAAVGPQVDGAKASAPLWAFGTADRWLKPSKDGAPGPGAYAPSLGLGKQVNSARASAPVYGMGSATRENVAKVYVTEEHNKALFGINSPGPAYVALTDAVGKQILSKNESQPGWVMGKSERFTYDHVKRAAGTPSPGSYDVTAAIGPQNSSTKPSTPRFGFGTSTREHAAKVYISSEHEKVTGGRDAPGPGAYPIGSMTGAQIRSSNNGVRADPPLPHRRYTACGCYHWLLYRLLYWLLYWRCYTGCVPAFFPAPTLPPRRGARSCARPSTDPSL